MANEDAAGTLDQFFAASQATGIGMDSLMGKVVQFGAQIVLSSGLDSPLFVCGASPFSELLSSVVRAAFADQIFRIK